MLETAADSRLVICASTQIGVTTGRVGIARLVRSMGGGRLPLVAGSAVPDAAVTVTPAGLTADLDMQHAS